MADDEMLRRIDDHMARGNELMVEIREEVRFSREDRADLREFIREHTMRAERIADRQVSALDALVLRQTEAIAEMHEMRRDMRSESDDTRDALRAQTQALLKVVDRIQ